MKDSSALLGKTDWELLMRASYATHQHFKGGLYRLLGTVLDSDTGEELVDKDGDVLVVYCHEYPHEKIMFSRKKREFFDEVERDGKTMRRFRPLGMTSQNKTMGV